MVHCGNYQIIKNHNIICSICCTIFTGNWIPKTIFLFSILFFMRWF